MRMEAGTADRRAEHDRALVDVAEYGTPGRAAWLDIDWPAYTQTAMIGGKKVNFVDYGDPSQPPVVLIHGLAASWQCWLENIPALAEDFRVVALDLPGFGESEMPRETISIDGYAHCVAELLDHLNIASASLIGNSMGGQTSVRFALDFPERTERVILVSPAGYSTSVVPPLARRAAKIVGPHIGKIGRANKALVRRPGMRRIAMYGICAHADRLSPDIVLQLMGFSKKPGLGDALAALLSHDFRSELPNVAAPLLLIWGRDDALIGSGDAHRMGAKIPNSRKLVLNDTAHVAMVERPAWFNATARDFLLENPA